MAMSRSAMPAHKFLGEYGTLLGQAAAMFDAVNPSIDRLLDRCPAVRMRGDRQSGLMGQLNQQMHLVGTELSSQDIGSGCGHAATGHHLDDVNPRWTRSRMAAVI